tara:strand:- start:128 stop:322 length:195 start_codon:yes stop_codon:yes gene_type:complete
MGGRGLNHQRKNTDRWDWLQDVETQRLKNYINRSTYLSGKPDPTGRSIHDVAYWAEKELEKRKN